MGAQHIYLAAWGDEDYEKTRGCRPGQHDGSLTDNSWYDHCKGDFAIGTRRVHCINCVDRVKCTEACGKNVKHKSGRSGHPCAGADNIKGIPINVSDRTDVVNLRSKFDDAPGAFDCTFNISGPILKKWSDQTLRKQSTGCGKSAYEQALFGVDGNCLNDTRDDAFCAKAENLAIVVDGNGDTCFDKLQAANKAAVAAQLGRDFCDANPTDDKCMCINLAKDIGDGTGFVGYCGQNPTHAGCSIINRELEKYDSLGVRRLYSMIGQATCLVPNICTDDKYLPINGAIPPCANQIAICDQALKFREGADVYALGDIVTNQACDIDFNTQIKEVCQPDEDGKCTKGSGYDIDESGEDMFGDGNGEEDGNGGDDAPSNPFEISEDTKKSIITGTGGVVISSSSCCAAILLMLLALS